MSIDNFIPVAIPDLGGNEEKYAAEAIRSSWISSTGKYIEEFESRFASMCQVRHCLGTANGTVALHLALMALDLAPGDEVIVPSLTYVATANAVRYVNAEPVFVDVSPTNWCIDPQAIEAAITPRTKGIIAVHLYGHPADMDAINAVAHRHGLWVVEDAAEAHFATYKGRTTGGLGDIATFSFYGNKTITCGEGGAVTFNDDRLLLRSRMLRGQGMDPDRRYFFPIVGYNYRLTNTACAILTAQLERATEIVAARRRICDLYTRKLAGTPGIGFQPVAEWAVVTPWLFCITVDPILYGRSRDELAEFLAKSRIDSRPFFISVHRLPPYAKNAGLHLPITDRLSETGMNLPTYNGLTNADIDRVVDTVRAHARSP
jgi:perosamine synthetase